MTKYNIPFSPPDISENEIDAVCNVLRSGWITTGPKNLEFEGMLKDYLHVNNALVLSSATAGEELPLKVFNFKPTDEVITTPYTYTATSSVYIHRGMRPIYVDVKKDSFLIDIDKIADKITPRTRCINTVDIGGAPVDYDKIKDMLKAIGRTDIMLMSDSAHALGAKYKGEPVGSQMDFHTFSFHAVKNLTTAEGGAITFNNNNFWGSQDLYKEMKLNALHGQSKDALAKTKAGAWKYDILTDGFKCNMTDIQAAIGIEQLKRYDTMQKIRREIFELYSKYLGEKDWAILPFECDDEGTRTSYHLYTLRVKGFDEEKRAAVIQELADLGIAVNVHFIPLPMFTLYKNLGYRIEDYPNTYAQYENEISLPIYSTLSLENAEIVVKNLINAVEKHLK